MSLSEAAIVDFSPSSRPATEPLSPIATLRPPLLVVEDDPLSRRTLVALLGLAGYRAESVGSAEEALRLAERRGVPLIALVDIDLPGISGLDLIRRLTQLDASIRPIVLSASNREGLVAMLEKLGVPFLRKPINFNRLTAVIEENGGRSWR